MSSSDPFDSGGSTGGGGSGSAGGPMDLINRASGRSLTDIATSGVGGWLLAVAAGAITGTQAVLDLLIVTPVQVMTDVLQTSGEAIFGAPLGIVPEGADQTSAALAEFGIFALPMAVAIVLVVYWGVTRYLSDEETSDLFVGGVSDYIPFIGADEEEE